MKIEHNILTFLKNCQTQKTLTTVCSFPTFQTEKYILLLKNVQ